VGSQPRLVVLFLSNHQQCDVNYIEIRRAAVWSYGFHKRIDGRVSPAEATGPYEKLPIPTNLDIVHITLLVEMMRMAGTSLQGTRLAATDVQRGHSVRRYLGAPRAPVCA